MDPKWKGMIVNIGETFVKMTAVSVCDERIYGCFKSVVDHAH